MDPNATLDEMLSCLRAGDFGGAACAAEDLRNWVKRGGFLPRSWDYVDPRDVEKLLTTLTLNFGDVATETYRVRD